MKTILGLDLGVASIGWAVVTEGENPGEAQIKQLGVRVNPLTSDEQGNFEKGKSITTNANRRLARGIRRNLQRYKLRRANLIQVLSESGIIHEKSVLAEDGKNTTFQTWQLRAKSATEKITLEELARVLLAINKKRGYKSSRKSKATDEGQAVDGMGIAKKLYDEQLTPGQFIFQTLWAGKKANFEFYRSDLQAEFDKIWNFQQRFYPELLTKEFYKELQGKGQRATAALFWIKYKFNTADIKGLEDDLKNERTIQTPIREQKKLQAYKWRSDGISKPLEKEQVAYVLTEINSNINNSSGYLGAISDRSKALYFNHETVGQYLYRQLQQNRHTPLTNQVFYRQDYMDEFETIWTTQSKFHPQLTPALKEEVRDIIIFYQRKLKSQKGLISLCEFECREMTINGHKKTVGLRVAPRSSPLSQEFKIWQILNNIEIRKTGSKKKMSKSTAPSGDRSPRLSADEKLLLFQELNVKGELTGDAALDLLGLDAKEWEINYKKLDGNKTNRALYNTFFKILEMEGCDKDLWTLSNKDGINISELKTPAAEIREMVKSIFETLQINTDILSFDATLSKEDFEKQPAYQLWHLLYASEDDTVKYSEEDQLLYGKDNIALKKKLCSTFGFKPEHAKILAHITFQNDYGSLSTKAMRKIYPHIKEKKYSEACEAAGYRHSKHSLTKEELAHRELKPKLDLLKKNSLRNPVVEKILNQMAHVVNTIIDQENDQLKKQGKEPDFHFDEIRIELARELKKSIQEREQMTKSINEAKNNHDKITRLLQTEFGIKHPTRNDIIRYKLYEELKNNQYRDLYTNEYIPREKLFSKEIDIEHIIPQARIFDDSFSNKTIAFREVNLEKGNSTAFDYIESNFGAEKLIDYQKRIEELFNLGKKNKEEGISKTKYKNLLKRVSEIGDGFIERDLRDSQYIAKKAKEMLFEITRSVVSTSGQITNRLREDWGLINVMKELNLPKYRELGLTEIQERKFGQEVEVIKEWTKRSDQRHHAMDALTIAFTKRSFIQYLNNLNARKESDEGISNSDQQIAIDTSDLKLSTRDVIAIENKETESRIDDNGNKKRVFKEPMPNFRSVAKAHIKNVIISYKAKNKVATKNKNKTRGNAIPQETWTPRGQLHKETVYGQYQYYEQKEEKIGSKFNEERIQQVANPLYRKLLLQRLAENGGDPKKAFSGKNALHKNPIYLDEERTAVLPDTVNLVWLEKDFSIRKEVTPDNFKDEKLINKIIDRGIREKLKMRLKEYGGDPKKAFSELDKNPIWLNKEKGIAIKRVTITGVNNAEPLHFKRDHFGKLILDESGNRIPVDYISTGNNHHVAIYRDGEGNLQETVVSFYEAMTRKNQKLPVIDKTYNQHLGWQFLFTLKQNELFVFPNEKTGFDPKSEDLLEPKNKTLISPNLFRVRKFTYNDYHFVHHLETIANDTIEQNKSLRNITWIATGKAHIGNIIKVRTNHLGEIISVGEY